MKDQPYVWGIEQEQAFQQQIKQQLAHIPSLKQPDFNK